MRDGMGSRGARQALSGGSTYRFEEDPKCSQEDVCEVNTEPWIVMGKEEEKSGGG